MPGAKKQPKRKWDTNCDVNIKYLPEAITVNTSIRNSYSKQESMESHLHNITKIYIEPIFPTVIQQ